MQEETEQRILTPTQKRIFIGAAVFLVIHFGFFSVFSFTSTTKFPKWHHFSQRYVMPFLFHSFAVFAPEPPTFSLSVYVQTASGEYIDPFEGYLEEHQQNRFGFSGTKYTIALNTIRKCYYAVQQTFGIEFNTVLPDAVNFLEQDKIAAIRKLPEFEKLAFLLQKSVEEQGLERATNRVLFVRTASALDPHLKKVENVFVVDLD